MATIAKNSGTAAVKKSKPAPAARRLRGSPEKTERNAAIVAAVRAGASRIAVAAEHGITRERVGAILKNAAKAGRHRPEKGRPGPPDHPNLPHSPHSRSTQPCVTTTLPGTPT